MAAGADIASAFLALHASAHLSMPSSVLKWRALRVLPSLYVPLDRRASMLFDLTRMVARHGVAPCSLG